MSDYYVTETLEEAQAHEAADYIDSYEASLKLPEDHWATTTAWSAPVQRLDGKWIRSFSPTSTSTGRTLETKDDSWFPEDTGEN